jgi:hypothetical protein
MTIKGMIVYKCSVGAGTISNIISSTREESVTSSYDFDLVLPIIGYIRRYIMLVLSALDHLESLGNHRNPIFGPVSE